MRVFLIGLLFLLCTNLNILAQNSINNLQPSEYFDFWVGEWELSWSNDNGVEGIGTNYIHKTLDGVVIQENFEAKEGNLEGFKGKSFSVYNPRKESWHQAWVDNEGSYIDLKGRVEGEKRIFQTNEIVTAKGDTMINRMVFYNIEENSFTWDWQYSTDVGESWVTSWQIIYKRAN